MAEYGGVNDLCTIIAVSLQMNDYSNGEMVCIRCNRFLGGSYLEVLEPLASPNNKISLFIKQLFYG